jgi:hypothetical protein
MYQETITRNAPDDPPDHGILGRAVSAHAAMGAKWHGCSGAVELRIAHKVGKTLGWRWICAMVAMISWPIRY